MLPTIRRILLLMAFLCLQACFLIRPVAQKLAYKERRSYYEKGHTVIPSTDVLDYSFDGHIVINVKLNNDTIARKYIVDNGLNSIISGDDVKSLDLKPLTSMTAYDANSNVQVFSVYRLDSFIIGKQVYYNYGFSAGDDLRSVPGKNVKNVTGFVGLNVLEQAVWSFNNLAGKVMIAASIDSIPAVRKTNFIKLKRRYDRWFVPVTIDGVRTEAILDLGYNGSLVVSKKMMAKIKPGHLLCYYGLTNRTLSGANYDSLYYSRAGTIRFVHSGIELHNKLICYSNSKLHLLGTGLLTENYVTIDLGHNALYLSPIVANAGKKSTAKTWGLNINKQAGHWIVTTMLKGSEAEQKGIHIGDKVIAVNNQNLETGTDKEHYQLLDGAFSNDISLSLELQRGNDAFSITLHNKTEY